MIRITETLLRCLLIFWAVPASAQLLMTQEEALRAAFPDSGSVTRQTLFLTDAQVGEIQKLARAKVESKLVIYYRATPAGKTTGYAFFETATVRTKPATIMAVVNPDGTLRLLQILAFHEPQDYLPAPRWLALFQNQYLNDELWPKRGIHNITGATLSVQALTLAARRLLATFIVAVPKESKS
jgi:hypothetical protein